MIIKKGMDKAVKIAIEAIDKKSRPVKTQEEMAQVATISSADEEIGSKIGEAMFKVGKDGVISSEVYAGLEIAVEYKEGMEFDKGYISSQFVNIPEKGEALVENPYILITDITISSGQEIAAFLEKFVKATGQKDIVIIAGDIGGSALLTLLANQLRGNINSLGIFAPAFAERRKDILEDIAVLTGCKFISKESNITIDKILDISPSSTSTGVNENNIVGIEKLGRADSIWSNDKMSRIVGGFGDAKKITERANKIRAEIKKEESDFEKEKLQDRLAKLISGAAIIKVGAKTELELSDKKERVIDAVEATRVVKEALQNAVSVAGAILCCEAIVCKIPEEVKPSQN